MKTGTFSGFLGGFFWGFFAALFPTSANSAWHTVGTYCVFVESMKG